MAAAGLNCLDLDKPPEVLSYEARQILDELSPAFAASDSAEDFVVEREPALMQHVRFWYRQSPRSLAEGREVGRLLSFTNPPPLVPGMRGVRLDAHGALVEYYRVPGPDDDTSAAPPDWRPSDGRGSSCRPLDPPRRRPSRRSSVT